MLPRFHPLVPGLVWRGLGALALLLVTACDKQSESAPAANDASASTDEKRQAKPAPPETAPPPPSVEGAVFDKGIYVQRCAEPCPDLLQEPGAKHCSGLQLAGRSWRLPSQDEAARFGSLEIEQTSGYHWTGTAYDQDDAQVWIVDPDSDQPTTVSKDRKPFRVRCVSDHQPTAGPKPTE